MHPEFLNTLKTRQLLKHVFRTLSGILFLFSATAKLIGIDAFELYLFGFGWFPLATAFLLARMVIAAEYTLGILLTANFAPRLAGWCSAAVLAGFSGFLLWLILTGEHGNCNCFGELVQMNPVQSLLKNMAMLGMLALSAGARPFPLPRKTLLTVLAVILPLAAVLIISPPDNWRYEAYSGAGVHEAALREAAADGTLPRSVTEGEHIVCFFSLRCEYCKLSARKLTTLRERGEFSQAPVIAIIGRGEDTDITPFLEETGFQPDEVHFLDPALFLRITRGTMPLILIMQDTTPVRQFHYRDLH